VAVEIRCDAGAEAVLQGVRGVEAAQHFMRDLGITWLVGAYESDAIPAEDRCDSIKNEEDSEDDEDRSFTNGGPIRQPFAGFFRRCRRFFRFPSS
jgi:hypothetical protein